MQDITEQQELAQEISDAISKPVGLGEQFDEVGERVHKIQIYSYPFGKEFHKPFTCMSHSLCCNEPDLLGQ